MTFPANDVLYTIFKEHISLEALQQAQVTSLTEDIPLFHILLTQNIITETGFLKALSRFFKIKTYRGVSLSAIEGLETDLETILQKTHVIRAISNNTQQNLPTVITLLEPQLLTLEHISAVVALSKAQNIPLFFTDQNSFRVTIENRYHAHFTQRALYSLQDKFCNASACTLSPNHFFKQNRTTLFLLSLSIMITFFLFAPVVILLFYGLGLLLTPLFIAIISLRFWAIIHLWNKRPASPSIVKKCDPLPIYTILVPLYREAKILPSLIAALKALDYPEEKLDIKLLLEQDDLQTQQKAKSLKLPAYFQCLIIPPSFPKTKPKALNYALNFAQGDYIVIYDAEDRPETDQLHKALHCFSQSPDSLACVQARLNTYNGNTNWLTQQFTLEYSALFNGLLPALAHLNLPFLLGGTSNHFKKTALKNVGGWDAFNVTEDADLGIRLYRLGYRCSTIESTTYEESCTRFSSWVKQRSRWLKGWMQTYCVHMKDPFRLWQQLGWKGLLCFQVLLGGQISASLSYLFFLIITFLLMINHIIFAQPLSLSNKGFLTFSVLLFLASTIINGWLSYLTAPKTKNKVFFLQAILSTPLYWGMISIAAFRALYQLFTKPFYWEKTEHGHSLTNSIDNH